MVNAGLNEIASTFFLLCRGPVGGPALTVECCLCRRTRRRPERQHPQAIRLLIMLNLLSRFNQAWRLTSVRHFIVYSPRKFVVAVD